MNDVEKLMRDASLSRKSQQQLASNLVNEVTEGTVNPIEAVVRMKAIYDSIDLFLKDESVRECVLAEAGKYDKNEMIESLGASIRVQESGSRYDYTVCGDPVWNALNEEFKQLEGEKKERELFLKNMRKPTTVVDDETGEVYTIYPAARTSKTNYVITFKKE